MADDEQNWSPREVRPRASERAELNAQKRDRFLGSEEGRNMIDRMQTIERRDDSIPDLPDVPAGAARVAPPLSQPPIGKPTVAGEPQVRTGRPSMPRMAPRGGGGMPQRGGARPDAAVPAPRQINPLGLSPGSPFKYEQGGMVKKHGSDTCVHSMTKHR